MNFRFGFSDDRQRKARSEWAQERRRYSDDVFLTLTRDEYRDLQRLARDGNDAGILGFAGIDEEMDDGGAVLVLGKDDVAAVNSKIDRDFLRGCTSRSLAQKMRKVFDAAL